MVSVLKGFETLRAMFPENTLTNACLQSIIKADFQQRSILTRKRGIDMIKTRQ